MPEPSGPPVLLVHGFASSFDRNWRDNGWVDLLQEAGREVIGIDFPGHGDADKPHDPAAYAALDEALEAKLPAAGVVDALGFSMGAGVLLDLAARRPDRFRRLVVGGTGANLFRESDMEPLAIAVETGEVPEGAPEMAGAFAQFARSPGNDHLALAACLRRGRAPMDPKELAAITCPVLVVLGDRDFAGPADPLVDALPDATFLGVPGLDHFAAPKDFRFLEAALRFLDAEPG